MALLIDELARMACILLLCASFCPSAASAVM